MLFCTKFVEMSVYHIFYLYRCLVKLGLDWKIIVASLLDFLNPVAAYGAGSRR